MYVCGMTVYDYCHLGHARVLVVFDVVRRWLRQSGYRVTYVRNITDIDDKIIRRAAENGEPIEALTGRFIRYMEEDAAALGVEKPDHEPRATQYVPQMLALIDELNQKRLAYQAGSGDVNYAVRRFPGYGKLSGKSLDELRAGERVEVDSSKDDPLDFVLWKRSKPEEPRWPSRWGEGRPGWHIECSAMSRALLGEQFDIHGGGQDLQFPHHENEIAQSEGAMGTDSGKPFVKYWMHNGFVRVDEEKMSKSLGNFFTVREVLKKYDAEVVRFFILRAHYRSPLNYSDVHLEDAKSALERLYTALKTLPAPHDALASALLGQDHIDWSEPFAHRFKKAMDDDFGTPEAVSVLFDMAREIGRGRLDLVPKLKSLGGVLGLLQRDPLEYLRAHRARRPEVHLDDDSVEQLVQQRSAAKAAKDFKKADDLRRVLTIYGVVVEDTKAGLSWRRASSFRLLELDELEDFRFEAKRFGYDPKNFEIKEFPDKTPTKGTYAISGQIEVRHLLTMHTERFQAGHGSTWLKDFSELASRRVF